MTGAYTAQERNGARRRAYQNRWNEARRIGIPTSYVPAAAAADYLAALHRLGWSNPALEYLTGGEVHRSTFSKLARQNYSSVQRTTADGILSIPWSLAPSSAIPDTCLIPSLGAQRRIQSLMRNGWTHPAIRGASVAGSKEIMRGRCVSIRAGIWRAVDTVFDQWSMERGPEPKASTAARRRGYAPPLAWDDIDDPDEHPHGMRRADVDYDGSNIVDEATVLRVLAGETLPTNTAERHEVVRRWLALGRSERSLCVRMGWKDGRYGREEMSA
jgi:hypothetical protein